VAPAAARPQVGAAFAITPATTSRFLDALCAARQTARPAGHRRHRAALLRAHETAIGDYRTFTKVSPPLRSEWDRRAVVEGLKDGTIDVIASDHSPQDQDSKRLPFQQAECGIIGLETLLPLGLELVA